MSTKLILTGQVFTRLTVLDEAPGRRGRTFWNVRCECGVLTVAESSKLRTGHTRSCGCLKADLGRKWGKGNRIHGLGHGHASPAYKTWSSMRYRCRDPKNETYFGRGITVCERWNSFDNFLQDMGERPAGTSIDRLDVNGNYEPGNCVWATNLEQGRNRRNTVYLVVDGKRVSIAKVAAELGIDKSAYTYFSKVTKILKAKFGYVPELESDKWSGKT